MAAQHNIITTTATTATTTWTRFVVVVVVVFVVSWHATPIGIAIPVHTHTHTGRSVFAFIHQFRSFVVLVVVDNVCT